MRGSGVEAVAFALLERELHPPVLAGVEGEDGDASAGFQALREVAEEGVECAEFIVHRDPQRLEDAADGVFHLRGLEPWLSSEGDADRIRESARAGGAGAEEGAGEERGVGLVGVFGEKLRELRLGERREQRGGGLAALGVHPQVERAVLLEGETARGIIDLHRGDAEVGEDGVRAADRREHLGEACEVLAMHDERSTGEAECTQPRFAFREFDGIDIEADEPSARLHRAQQLARMTAVAERAIHDDLAGLRREHFEDLAHHDRAMRARGRLAAGEDLGHVLGVTRGIVLLVFLVELPRVLSAVAHAALGFLLLAHRGKGNARQVFLLMS